VPYGKMKEIKMQGLKTYFTALVLATVPLLTEKLGLVDWNSILIDAGVPVNYVAPAATIVSAAVMIVMRYITQVTTVKTALETVPPVK